MIGAGATGRAIALQLGTPVPGIRLAGIANRTPAHAERAFREAGITRWTTTDAARPSPTQHSARRAGADRRPVAPRPALPTIDLVVEVDRHGRLRRRVTLDAIAHGKHTVIVNAELDSPSGRFSRPRPTQAGVVLTNTDGDEPGVAMTLFRYLRSLGLTSGGGRQHQGHGRLLPEPRHAASLRRAERPGRPRK